MAQQTGLTGKACECDCHGLAFVTPIWCTAGDCVSATTSINCDTTGCNTLNLNNP